MRWETKNTCRWPIVIVNKCAKNLCKRTVLVKLIIENVVNFVQDRSSFRHITKQQCKGNEGKSNSGILIAHPGTICRWVILHAVGLSVCLSQKCDTNYWSKYIYLSSNAMQFHQLWSGMLIWHTAQVVQIAWWMSLIDVLSRLGNVCSPVSKSHLSQCRLNTISGQWFDTWKIMICTSSYLCQHITYNYYFTLLHWLHFPELLQVRPGSTKALPTKQLWGCYSVHQDYRSCLVFGIRPWDRQWKTNEWRQPWLIWPLASQL